MNYLYYLLKSALLDFRRNKVRTFLTSLGILIGVSSVVLLISLGVGLRTYLQQQFESLGTNLLVVVPGKILQGGNFRSGPGAIGSITFDEQDVRALSRISNASYVVPAFVKSTEASSGRKTEAADMYGTSQDIFVVRNLTIQYGRLFTKSDNNKSAKVAVIGPKLAEKLFVDASAAVGRQVKIGGQAFRVVGVLNSKGGGGLGGPDFDSFIYIPYKSGTSFNPGKTFLSILIKVKNGDMISFVKTSATTILEKRHNGDDFSIVEQTEILNAINSIFAVLNNILILIGAISLIVGGIGIMNIMYVSVVERTKEVGIRRAIGATRKDILTQFLAESVLLSLIGGGSGLLLSFLLTLLIQRFFPARLDMMSVLLSIGVSSFIGVLFGVFPARKAANLSPLEAIRYE